MATTGRDGGDPEAPSPMLTVAAVARRLGVAPSTLRTWDRRYDLGPSAHTAGSHRRYGPDDLARLVVMRRLTLEGVPPADAARTGPAPPPGPRAPAAAGRRAAGGRRPDRARRLAGPGIHGPLGLRAGRRRAERQFRRHRRVIGGRQRRSRPPGHRPER